MSKVHKGRNKTRKSNKEKNLKKKKKAKFKSKDKSYNEKCQDSEKAVNSLCYEFQKLNKSKVASPQQIIKAKHRRDQRMLDRNVKGLCRDLDKMFQKTSNNEGTNKEKEEEECFAAVENLSKNISDLIITNENHEPGFRFTRWQQRRFQQVTRRQKIKYQYKADDDVVLDDQM